MPTQCHAADMQDRLSVKESREDGSGLHGFFYAEDHHAAFGCGINRKDVTGDGNVKRHQLGSIASDRMAPKPSQNPYIN